MSQQEAGPALPGGGGGVGTILIAGPPACGKSTQCAKLLSRFGLVHVAAGDLLRARTKFLPELAAYIDNGQLVPDKLVCAIVKERLGQDDCKERGVLLDGFPRTREQAEVLAAMGITVSHVVLLEVPDEVVIGRVSGRRIDPVSGQVYNVDLGAPPDAAVAARLITRTDDTREKMVKRLKVYHDNIALVLGFYGQHCVRAINADAHPEKVFDEIRYALEGELYWGCVISREWPVRSYEASSIFDLGSTDLLTIARYTDHLAFLMQGRGVLGDVRIPISFGAGGQARGPRFASQDHVTFATRAHRIEKLQTLVPGLKLQLRLWLHEVGTRSVDLRAEVYTTHGDVEDVIRLLTVTGQQRQYVDLAKRMLLGDALDSAAATRLRSSAPTFKYASKPGPRPAAQPFAVVQQQQQQQASASAAAAATIARIPIAHSLLTLVVLDKNGRPQDIPQGERLRSLAKAGRGVIGDDVVAGGLAGSVMYSSKARLAFPRPRGPLACVELVVRPMDVGHDGLLNAATMMGYMENARVQVLSSEITGQTTEYPRRVVHSAAFEAVGAAMAKAYDRLTVEAWAVPPEQAKAQTGLDRPGFSYMAFEAKLNKRPFGRGWELLQEDAASSSSRASL